MIQRKQPPTASDARLAARKSEQTFIMSGTPMEVSANTGVFKSSLVKIFWLGTWKHVHLCICEYLDHV